jgi:hypothetical protein
MAHPSKNTGCVYVTEEGDSHFSIVPGFLFLTMLFTVPGPVACVEKTQHRDWHINCSTAVSLDHRLGNEDGVFGLQIGH